MSDHHSRRRRRSQSLDEEGVDIATTLNQAAGPRHESPDAYASETRAEKRRRTFKLSESEEPHIPDLESPQTPGTSRSQESAESIATRSIGESVIVVNETNQQDLRAMGDQGRHIDEITSTEHTRISGGHEAKITQLEEELRQARKALETEKMGHIALEVARVKQDACLPEERYVALTNQLAEFIRVFGENKSSRKKEPSDQRGEKKLSQHEEMEVTQRKLPGLIDDLIRDRKQWIHLEEEHGREAEKPGIDAVLEALQKQQAEQQELKTLVEGWKNDAATNQQGILGAIRRTEQEQIPFNVDKYLDEFSKALAQEVRMLLAEVGKLREERRGLQYEIGFLLCTRSKYGAGGEFQADWKPTTGPLAPPPPPSL